MYGNAGFCLLVGNDILEDLASHMSDGTVLAQKSLPWRWEIHTFVI